MISAEALTTPLTVAEVKASIYTGLAQVGVSTTSWKPGAVVRTMVALLAVLVAAMSQLMALTARSGFLELSSGAWLTLVARYVYGVERIEATFAPGEITLVNSGGGVFLLDPGDLIVKNPTTGKTYRNTAAISLGAGATLTAIPIAAVESGSESTSSPGTITAFETSLLNVSVTNPLAVVGLDEETDPLLRARCADKLGSLSPNGPPDAYRFAARSAVHADGTSVGVTRVKTSKDGFGNVFTYCATATGGITGTEGDIATDLGLIHENILNNAATLSDTPHTLSATPKIIAIEYTVWCYNTVGLTSAALQLEIAEALTSYMSEQPIGGNDGFIHNDDLTAEIHNLHPEIWRVTLQVPAASTAIGATEVPVLGAVAATAIHLVSP